MSETSNEETNRPLYKIAVTIDREVRLVEIAEWIDKEIHRIQEAERITIFMKMKHGKARLKAEHELLIRMAQHFIHE